MRFRCHSLSRPPPPPSSLLLPQLPPPHPHPTYPPIPLPILPARCLTSRLASLRYQSGEQTGVIRRDGASRVVTCRLSLTVVGGGGRRIGVGGGWGWGFVGEGGVVERRRERSEGRAEFGPCNMISWSNTVRFSVHLSVPLRLLLYK